MTKENTNLLKLINPEENHFKLFDFINVYLDLPLVWSTNNYNQNGHVGSMINGYDDEDNFVGFVFILDVTEDKSELDITKLNNEELNNYETHLHKEYKNHWGENLLSWNGYEIVTTKQGIKGFVTKCTILEDDGKNKFDYTLRTCFRDRVIYAAVGLKDNGLNFLNYFTGFKEIILNISFDD